MVNINLNHHLTSTNDVRQDIDVDGREIFNPKKFFTPGWNGESLVSKPGLQLKKILFKIQTDVLRQFEAMEQINRTRKEDIYEEFVIFCHEYSYAPEGLETPEQFWESLFQQETAEQPYLKKFKHIISFRIAVIYLMKIRLLKEICEYTSKNLEVKDLQNPNALFTNLLPDANNFKAKIYAFKGNAYSWYRPGKKLISNALKMLPCFSEISQTELVKIFRVEDPDDKDENNRMDHFSHSLSHVNYGHFLNTMVSQFPSWMGEKKLTSPSSTIDHSKVTDCKVTGDHIEAIAQSLWLSQRQNIKSPGKNLLVPNFNGEAFHSGLFLQICSQLQFIIQYLKYAGINDISPVDFLSKLFKHSFTAMQSQPMFQTPIFSDLEIQTENNIYNNIILNISDSPKKNPHFHLLAQIQKQLQDLSQNGYLYTFSNKKFFVPSQSEKIDQLLKQAQLVATFNLEDLKGKGEVASYLYIFKKCKPQKTDFIKSSDFFQNNSIGLKLDKAPCLSFRISGKLNSFYKFSVIENEIKSFFKNKTISSTPLYQKELDKTLTFEFFKDAIVDGRLINSSSQDSSKITHPQFFKSLLKTSLPFGHLFAIEPLAQDLSIKKKSSQGIFAAASWLGGDNKLENNYSAVLIVDFRNSHKVRVEIINVEAYKGKANEYGYALCQYFGLVPKQERLNINLFREFFSSSMGDQIMQLCLAGGSSKIKAKLQSLLIPKIFLETKELPVNIAQNLKFIVQSKEQLLRYSPENLISDFEKVEPFILMLLKQYPWAVLGLLVQFNSHLKACSLALELPHLAKNTLNFNNPVLREALLACPLHNIFPNNNDFYVEFNNSLLQDLSLGLEEMELKASKDQDQQNQYSLDLISNKRCIVKIFADKNILEFLKYLISNFSGVPISQILQGIKAPSLEDINSCTHKFLNTSKSFHHLEEKITKLIDDSFKQSLLAR